MLGWHFTTADRNLRYGDDRIVEPGQMLVVEGVTPVLCESGLHASRLIMDALRYAPGPYVWRVELGGMIVKGDDKVTASERMALWGFDASDLFWRFARRCALDRIDQWDPPDVVVRYLKTGDESLRSAARSAAEYAAEYAARSAARYVAEYAARSAAEYAARSAAYAARSAAEYAAESAARYVAEYAARSARSARSAARKKQNARLTAMVMSEAKKRGLV